MPKPFLSFEDQIKHLKENKNLTIDDKDFAKRQLAQIGYFGLIGGYKDPFRNSTTKKFKDGTKFEDIVALYKFDENLRELFLKYLLQIERHLRSLLSYYFTQKYGESQTHYLSSGSYINNVNCNQDISKLISTLDDLAQSTDYPYINHQRNTYGNVPLWVLINGVTFGSLSKFYSLLTHDLKAKIAKHFAQVNEKQLEQYLKVLTKFRNVCAHNERLFSYKTLNDIPDTVAHNKLGITKNGTQYIYGKRDLFAVVIALKYLLPKENFKKFSRMLSRIIEFYLRNTTAISRVNLYTYMGFPTNWEKIKNLK